MAYTAVDKALSFFRPYNHTGTGSSGTVTDVGFTPDMFWHKNRANNQGHGIIDSVRGNGNYISPNTTNAQLSDVGSYGITSGGFTFPNGDAFFNGNGNQIIFWSWLMGGTAPSQTYKVVVVSDSGNKYRFRNSTDTATFGSSAVTLDLQEGGTYTFDVSDSTMNSHPFVIGTAANSSEYSTGVTYKLDGVTKTYSQYTSGFSSATSRQLIITVANSAPALYYWCSVHSGMGGAINTNTTFGSSNFDGTLQSTVSANTTAGFSIIRYTGNATNSTVGHGLGATPDLMMVKNLTSSGGSAEHWRVQHNKVSASNVLYLNRDVAQDSNGDFQSTYPTSSSFSISSADGCNKTGEAHIAYCFTSIPGYSKFGTYIGNNSASNGPFVWTGFKPEFTIVKRYDVANDWNMQAYENNENGIDKALQANSNGAELVDGGYKIDKLSNGFKMKEAGSETNADGGLYIYMAIGQTLVGSNNVPATAQ